jgi:hypothetical protein
LGLLGSDEEVVRTDEWFGLQREIATVHLELAGEVVETL